MEFSMTFHCTGKCRHCSVGEEGAKEHPGHLSYEKMAGMLHTLSEQFPMTSVMCFGGEPLLYPADVCAVYREARESGLPQRQLITNGFFSREPEKSAGPRHSSRMRGLPSCCSPWTRFTKRRYPWNQ